MLSRLSVSASYKLLLRTSRATEKLISTRCLHFACSGRNVTLKNNLILDVRKLSNRLIILPVRHESTSNTDLTSDLLNAIPDPPIPLSVKDEVVQTALSFHPNGEPTFASLGLGNYTGSGLVEKFLECLHINMDLPWWQSIIILTLCVRLIAFPLMVTSQRSSVNMSNNSAEMQEIQMKITAAKQCGNDYDAMLYTYELQNFMKEKGIKPLRAMGVTILQMPLYISCFFALRNMANAPVESLKEGGLWWFTDLTISDPYYILPVATCITMMTTMQLSFTTAPSAFSKYMKYMVVIVPACVLPFMVNFPASVLCYWITTNFVTLIQALLLRCNAVRNLLKIPIHITPNKSKNPESRQSFKATVKNTWKNLKQKKYVEQDIYMTRSQFHKSAAGPVVKTYKYDPTKQGKDVETVSTSKR